MKIPKAPRMRLTGKPSSDHCPEIGDLGLVACRDRYVIGVIATGDPITVSYGDFVVEVNPGNCAIGKRRLFKPSAGELIGKSFTDIQDARVQLRAHRI